VERQLTYLIQYSAVVEGHSECVTDVTLLRVVVVDSELLVFDTLNLQAKRRMKRVRIRPSSGNASLSSP
jgi:ADP-glucose pyrophosphorylase